MNNRPKISNVTYFKFPIHGAETNLEYVKYMLKNMLKCMNVALMAS